MLKYEIADINEIDESLRSQYAREGDEGPYRLTLELPANHSVEDVAGLKSALTKERANNKSLVARVAELEGEGKNATHTLAGKVEQLSDQNARLLKSLNEQRVKNTCSEAIAAAKGVAALLMPVLEKCVTIERDAVVVKDDAGAVMLNANGHPVTVSEYVSTLRGRDEFGGAFLGTGSSGGGSPPSSGNGGVGVGVGVVTKPRSKMTVAEKAAYLKTHGTEKFMELPT